MFNCGVTLCEAAYGPLQLSNENSVCLHIRCDQNGFHRTHEDMRIIDKLGDQFIVMLFMSAVSLYRK
jgi:hypothetical protein